MVAKKNSKDTVKKPVTIKKATATPNSRKNSKNKKINNKKSTTRNSKRKSIMQRMNEEEDDVEYSLLMKIKAFLATHLDNYESNYGRWIEGSLFFANTLAIVLFILYTYSFTGEIAKWLFIFEIILVIIFIIEYSLRMWVARNKTHHFFNVYSLIDLISILPVLVNFVNLTFFRIFRILRLFRLLRVLRFQRMFKTKNTLFGALNDTEIIVIRIMLTVFTIIFMFAGLIWAVENVVNPGQFGTIWDAFYFAIVTLSTVGYGDVTPLSSLGKIITVLMILSGIALIPWQLGKLLKVLVSAGKKQNITCGKCGVEEHDLDAVHCKMCGTILKHDRGLDSDELELEMAETVLIK